MAGLISIHALRETEQEEGENPMNINEMSRAEIRDRICAMASNLSEEAQQELIDLFETAVSMQSAVVLAETITNVQDTSLEALGKADEVEESIGTLIENIDAYTWQMHEELTEVNEVLQEQNSVLVDLLDATLEVLGVDAERVAKIAEIACKARENAADRGSPGSDWAQNVPDNASARNKASLQGSRGSEPVNSRGDQQGYVKEDVGMNGHDSTGDAFHDNLVRAAIAYDTRRSLLGR